MEQKVLSHDPARGTFKFTNACARLNVECQ